MTNFERFIPIWKDIKSYNSSVFRSDLVAGLTVGVMLVPQGMAYAYLAGMPPIYGLYGGLIPLLVYAMFGSSRQLSIGPVAISSLLILAGVSKIASPESSEFIGLVITIGLLVGLMQLLLSFVRLGYLVNFLSHPVLSGFTSGAAIIISITQLKDLLGIQIPRFDHPFETVTYALQHWDEANLYAILICISAMVAMVLMKKFNKSIPGALIVVVTGLLCTWLFRWDLDGLQVIGAVPDGLPSIMIPVLSLASIKLLYPTVLTVTIIGIVESISIAKTLESKHNYYEVRANQELFALGLAKVFGSFFQALPSSGSFTRSAINNDAGGKTGIASLVAAGLVGLTLILFTPLFYFMPKAILAAIILLAVRSLFEFETAKHLWMTHKRDFAMMVVTFITTLLLGIEAGILFGVSLSILTMLYKSSKPNIVELGRVEGSNHYRNVNRFEELELRKDVLIVRMDEQLYFANTAYFKEQIRRLRKRKGSDLRNFILDGRGIHDMDSSGITALKNLQNEMSGASVGFFICGAIGPVRDRLFKSGMMDELGKGNHFMYIEDALAFIDAKSEDEQAQMWSANAIQTKHKK